MSAATLLNLLINGLIEGAVIALPALALTLIMAIARFPQAATGDIATLGAYVAVGLQALAIAAGIQATLPSMVIGTVGAAIAGAIVSTLAWRWIFSRLSRAPMVSSLLAAIGLAFFLRSLIALVVGHDQRTFAVPLVRAWNFNGVRLLPSDLVIAITATAVLAAVFIWLRYSRSGRLLRALADNADLARLSGIRTHTLMWQLWAIAGALSGLGGILLGVKSVVMPELGWELLLPAFAAMIVGGIGSPVGAVAGALLLGMGQELSVQWVGPSYKIVVSFAVLLIVLLVRPAGLFGRPEAVR